MPPFWTLLSRLCGSLSHAMARFARGGSMGSRREKKGCCLMGVEGCYQNHEPETMIKCNTD